ncbi:MAG: RsmG family class I SAM-dependent methyltransferase [Balneolaceae bacterium]|nr:RsmG family class I SAM-dependent methyltransferase [Balneolaceae bacterium]MDR9446447.1 RsmG family class I SAM-dependent methyltransferase [Balneolaceae bacterium]
MFHVKQSDFLQSSKQLVQEHESALNHYADQLLWWNEKVNLVSRDVSRETIMKHVEHSIVLSPWLHELSHWVDAGTGGGLPGIPLAIVNPGVTFTLNDIVQKKCTILKSMVRTLDLPNVQIQEGSIENVNLNTHMGVCTKHAFKIPQLLDMFHKTSSHPGAILWLKGMEEATKDINARKDREAFEVFSLDCEYDPFYEGKAVVKWTAS